MFSGEAIKRRKLQNTVMLIWLTGAILAFFLLQLAIHQYVQYPSDFGLNESELGISIDKISKKYQEPLVAIYAPWLSIMIATFLLGDSLLKEQLIEKDKVIVAISLSVVFQVLIIYSAYVFLFPTQPGVNDIGFKPLPTLFISLIGTIVTFTFPEHKKTPTRSRKRASAKKPIHPTPKNGAADG